MKINVMSRILMSDFREEKKVENFFSGVVYFRAKHVTFPELRQLYFSYIYYNTYSTFPFYLKNLRLIARFISQSDYVMFRPIYVYRKEPAPPQM